MSPLQISKLFTSYQVPFNVALKNKTSEDVSLLVIDSIVDGNSKFLESIPNQFQTNSVLQQNGCNGKVPLGVILEILIFDEKTKFAKRHRSESNV